MAAAVVTLVCGGFVSTGPAHAATQPQPRPLQSRTQSSTHSFGVNSDRKRMFTGRHTQSMPLAPAQPAVACTATWRVVASQNLTWNNVLGGIASVSPTDMWAVGYYQLPTPSQYANGEQALAEHWDGANWTIVPTPQPGTDANLLNGVGAIATNDVWAVGGQNTGGTTTGLALHWDGSHWQPFALPPSPYAFIANDVIAFASNNVVVVGTQLALVSGTYTDIPYVVKYNGSSWGYLPTPLPPSSTGDSELFGVGGASSTDLWAVGYSRQTSGSYRREYVARYNGTSWDVNKTIDAGFDRTLTSVAELSATDIMAVGFSSGARSEFISQHFVGTGSSDVVDPSAAQYNALGDVVVDGSGYLAVGFSIANSSAAAMPVYATWGGTSWTYATAQQGGPGDSPLFTVAVAAAGDLWSAGLAANSQGLDQTLVENYSAVGQPTGVTLTPGDQQINVAWTAPGCDGGSSITSYVVTAYDGCTVQGSKTVTGVTNFDYTGLTNGSTFTFTVAAVNGFGVGPASSSPVPVTLNGATKPVYVTGCSSHQYVLTGNNGSLWSDIDPQALAVSFTPAADSYAIVSGNADLWTVNAGFNQDIGVFVSGGGVYPTTAGQPEAWKESGGFAGTFSPNAAYVQAVIPVTHDVPYTAKLQWKANKPDAGTIVAGAGPIGAAFSPTRITVQLVPVASALVFKASSTQQYHLTGSNGSTWVNMDATNLSVPFTVPATGTNWAAFVQGNADLWTAQAGYNQDIGVAVTGSGFPTNVGQPETWKESGGFAGTFSPNAAFVTGAIFVNAGESYTAKLQWKTNKPDSGTIFAGAGPIGGKYSPTSLTVVLVPFNSSNRYYGSHVQFNQVNSDGSYWQLVDPAAVLDVTTIAADASYLVSANADLWTTVAGYNQDIGIMVSGGAYGPGTVVAWKESGGFAGTFSPNAAYVAAELHLQTGINYKVSLVWKANKIATVSNAIYMGAGPIGGQYSPSWLIAIQLGSP